jgi:hypothetical protein
MVDVDAAEPLEALDLQDVEHPLAVPQPAAGQPRKAGSVALELVGIFVREPLRRSA